MYLEVYRIWTGVPVYIYSRCTGVPSCTWRYTGSGLEYGCIYVYILGVLKYLYIYVLGVLEYLAIPGGIQDLDWSTCIYIF